MIYVTVVVKMQCTLIDFLSNATLKLVLSYILNSEYSVCDDDDRNVSENRMQLVFLKFYNTDL
jgi:hypothetical protein